MTEDIADLRGGCLPCYDDGWARLYLGPAAAVLRDLPSESVDCCVTSPPYWNQRDYGAGADELGSEATPTEYVENLAAVFAEALRVMRPGGTLWLNLDDTYSGKANGGDSYDRHRGAGHKGGIVAKQRNSLAFAPYKGMLGLPWRVALAVQDTGWTLRNDIIWHKPNCIPESATDRLTRRYEHVFMFSKGPRYFYDLDAIRVPHRPSSLARAASHRSPSGFINADHPSDTAKQMAVERMCHPNGANPGDVWEIPNTGYEGAHFATFPIELPRRCILAGCPEGGTVLDPCSGSGTTGAAARALGRRYIGIDLKREYHDLAIARFAQGVLDLEASA